MPVQTVDVLKDLSEDLEIQEILKIWQIITLKET